MVKVIVGPSSQIFYAHEGILTKVDYFDRTLNGGFMESKTREGNPARRRSSDLFLCSGVSLQRRIFSEVQDGGRHEGGQRSKEYSWL